MLGDNDDSLIRLLPAAAQPSASSCPTKTGNKVTKQAPVSLQFRQGLKWEPTRILSIVVIVGFLVDVRSILYVVVVVSSMLYS